MNKFLTPLVCAGAMAVATATAPLQAAKESLRRTQDRPNIIFILADDLGWADVGYNGAPFYETPNIDQLASEGMLFDRSYTGGANCAPTRACLMSGMYTPRHKIYQPGGKSKAGLKDFQKMRLLTPNRYKKNEGNNEFEAIDSLNPKTPLRAGTHCLAEVLKPCGYKTAMLGKWHLGDSEHQGFDLFSADGTDNPYGKRYGNIDVAETLTDRAVQLLEENKTGPFFLYLAHWDVHKPTRARKDVVEKYAKKKMSQEWEHKTFTRWLVINRRMKTNPLDGLSMLNTRVDRRHDRRALSADEFSRLLQAAETGPPIDSIVGTDRVMLYILAAWTGLRKGEIGSLTLKSFRLKANPPTVTVAAAYSKHRREDTQVLHPEVVRRIRKWLKSRKPADGEILFPVSARTCGVNRKTAKMMREDLAAARRAWLADIEDPQEFKRREKSDFLKYRNSEGRFADFHANRHTFITNLCKADVAPKTVQTLARHGDIRLTMNLYSHVDLEDQSAAIARLPGVDDGNGEQVAG